MSVSEDDKWSKLANEEFDIELSAFHQIGADSDKERYNYLKENSIDTILGDAIEYASDEVFPLSNEDLLLYLFDKGAKSDKIGQLLLCNNNYYCEIYNKIVMMSVENFIKINKKTHLNLTYENEEKFDTQIREAAATEDVNTIVNLLELLIPEWTDNYKARDAFYEIFNVCIKTKSPTLRDMIHKLSDMIICRCASCCCGGNFSSINSCGMLMMFNRDKLY